MVLATVCSIGVWVPDLLGVEVEPGTESRASLTPFIERRLEEVLVCGAEDVMTAVGEGGQ